jgi:ABC-type bacteriocin/lantibiotic exporter with double-glycine peptidase domain
MRHWRQLLRLLEGSRRQVLVSLALSLGQSILLIPIALLVRQGFDQAIPQNDTGQLVLIGAGILALFLASSALGLLTRWIALKATKRSVAVLRGKLLAKIFTLPRAYFDRSDLGKLHSVVVADTERLDQMSNALVTMLLPAATIAVALGIALVVLDPLLAAVLFCSIPPMAVLSASLAKALRSRTRAFQRHFDVFSSQTHTALRGITLTKLHAAEELELNRRTGQFGELGEAGRRMTWLQGAYFLLNNTVAAIAGVIVLVVGGVAVADGRMTIGDLISFYAILGLMRTQITAVLASLPQLISGGESLERLEGILDEPAREPYTGTRRIHFRGGVALGGVSFAYAERTILHEVSLALEPGESVALVGPNGAGKSTALSLILGLYAPQSGRVLADGIPLSEIDLPDLRRQIGVVLQDSLILPSTVRENIAYGRPDATMPDIERAAGYAGAERFIGQLPVGYETHVGDDGVLLSGGQRQRIAIARALLHHPSLLVLDEPATYLDDAEDGSLLRPISAMPERPSVLIVSHDPAVGSLVDRVYHLRDGRIQGDPGEESPPAPVPIWAARNRK